MCETDATDCGLILDFGFLINWVSELTINANQDQRHA
jgi:hypothetical protein